MMQELPISIKSSHLMNVMLAELKLLQSKRSRSEAHLELGTRGGGLENALRAMTSNVEELNKSIGAYNKYTVEKQRYDAVLNSLITKRQAENEARVARGEPKLSIDELKRAHKQPILQTKSGMLDLFLNSADIGSYSDFTAHVGRAPFVRLFNSSDCR